MESVEVRKTELVENENIDKPDTEMLNVQKADLIEVITDIATAYEKIENGEASDLVRKALETARKLLRGAEIEPSKQRLS